MSISLHTAIDHLIITAPSLEAGVQYVQQQLNVTPVTGGEHTRMGTHNCLLNLGDEIYLEVIAINPAAATPGRPRWFELDNVSPADKPTLATWVTRTTDIYEAVKQSPVPLGKIETMSRGDLSWLITIPEDGVMPMNGMMPVLIQWLGEVRPTKRLKDDSCSLIQLEIFHPDAEAIKKHLQQIHFSGNVLIQQSTEKNITAVIKSPKGICKL